LANCRSELWAKRTNWWGWTSASSAGPPVGAGSASSSAPGGRSSRRRGRGRLTGRELVDGRLELGHHARHRHAVEHALTVCEEVEDLLTGAGQPRGAAVEDEVGAGHLAAGFPQALDGPAGRLQGHAGVEQPLDDLQLEQVAVGVAPLGATAARLA